MSPRSAGFSDIPICGTGGSSRDGKRATRIVLFSYWLSRRHWKTDRRLSGFCPSPTRHRNGLTKRSKFLLLPNAASDWMMSAPGSCSAKSIALSGRDRICDRWMTIAVITVRYRRRCLPRSEAALWRLPATPATGRHIALNRFLRVFFSW